MADRMGLTISMLALAISVGEAQSRAAIRQIIPLGAIGEGDHPSAIGIDLLHLTTGLPRLL